MDSSGVPGTRCSAREVFPFVLDAQRRAQRRLVRRGKLQIAQPRARADDVLIRIMVLGEDLHFLHGRRIRKLLFDRTKLVLRRRFLIRYMM